MIGYRLAAINDYYWCPYMAFSTHEPASFESLEQVLQRAGALVAAAKAHGSFCGSVCLLGPQAAPAWIAEMFAVSGGNDVLANECTDVLLQIAASTYDHLQEGDMSFIMLLPSDDEDLELRTVDLAKWCQGFKQSFSAAGEDDPKAREIVDSGIVQEILHDFSEIARATAAPAGDNLEDETAYMELVEYVRASVQLLFEETVPLRDGSSLVN